MQAIYYPMNKVEVDSTVDKYLKVVSNHDEYCLWFDVRKAEVNEIGQIAMPMPTAGLHTCVSRSRLGQINDAQRNTKYSTCLRKMLKEFVKLNDSLPRSILCISELTLLPIIAASVVSEFHTVCSTDITQIVVCESNPQMRSFLNHYEKKNKHLFSHVEIIYHSIRALELDANDLPIKVGFSSGLLS